MNTKHTPGPWEFKSYADFDIDITSEDSVIATTGHDPSYSYEEEKANARLIAAAPDLLELLKSLEQHLRPRLNNTCDLILQTIRKADPDYQPTTR